MPEIDYVRVYDSELKRTFTAVRSAVTDVESLVVLQDHPALDEYGNPAAPEFDVESKPRSGKAANPEKEKSNG